MAASFEEGRPPDNGGGGRNAKCSVLRSSVGTFMGIYNDPTGYSGLIRTSKKFCDKPGKAHWNAVMQIIQYRLRIQDLGLTVWGREGVRCCINVLLTPATLSWSVHGSTLTQGNRCSQKDYSGNIIRSTIR